MWQSKAKWMTTDEPTATHVLKLAERNKLYDVPLSDVSIVISQQARITVQSIHCREVRRTDTHDDDGVG